MLNVTLEGAIEETQGGDKMSLGTVVCIIDDGM